MALDLLGAAPFAIVSAAVSWIGAIYVHRDRKRVQAVESADKLKIHSDELMFELMKEARAEVSVAYEEMKELRAEVKTLRGLEQHFFHFQQSLDHLEAILAATTPEARAIADRNAMAFLTRMRRLNEAKGTIRNEVQRTESAVAVAEKIISDAEKMK